MPEKLNRVPLIKDGLKPGQRQEIISGLMKGAKVDDSIMYKWEYEDHPEKNGHSAYEDFCKNPMYQKMLIMPEMELLQKHRDVIKNMIMKKSTKQLWDWGPGNEKAKNFSKIFFPGGVNNRLEYFPIDISEKACQDAKTQMQGEGYKITKKYVDSFFGTNMSSDAKGPLHLCLGLTAGNFGGIHKIVQEMRTQDTTIPPQVIMSYGTTLNPESKDYDKHVSMRKAAYGDPDTNNPFFCLEAYQSMNYLFSNTFAALGFDTEKLELCVDYFDGVGIKIGMKVKKGEIVSMDIDKAKYEKSDQDPYMRLCTSERYTKEQAEKALREHRQIGRNGLKVSDTHNGIGILVFEKPNSLPALRKKHRHKAKNALLATLLFGGVVWGHNEYQDYRYEKKVHNKVLDNMKYKFDEKTGQLEFGGEVLDLSSDKGKLLLIQGFAEALYEHLKVRYKNAILPKKNRVIKALMLTLSTGDNLKYMIDVNIPGYDIIGENKIYFLDHVFWPNFINMSAEIENIGLYEHLKQYEGAMKSTLRMEDNFTITDDQPNHADGHRTSYKKGEIKALGDYISSHGKRYKIAKANITGKNYLVACQYWDDHPNREYSTIYGKKVALDYFKKGYADILATKILDMMPQRFKQPRWAKDKTPQQKYSHSYSKLGAGPIETPITIMSSMITQINMDGYDISFLIDPGNEELILRFIAEFLPKYYNNLSAKQKFTLSNYLEIDTVIEHPGMDVLNHITLFLNTYYYADDGYPRKQNLVLLQKELLREMLLTKNKQYLELETDDDVFLYLYERKELCKKYGFLLQTWEDFSRFEKGFKGLLKGDIEKNAKLIDHSEQNAKQLSGLFDFMMTSRDISYFNNFYRTKDGKVFSVWMGGGGYPVALEITDTNNHLALKTAGKDIYHYLDDINKGVLRADNYSKSMQQYTKIRDEYLTPTYDAAKIVARDYITHKYITPHAGRVVKYLFTTYSMCDIANIYTDAQKYEAVTNIVENSMLNLWLESELHSTAEEEKPWTLLIHTDIDELDKRVETYLLPNVKQDLAAYFNLTNKISKHTGDKKHQQ